ncbi:MAG: ATP-dependent helicase [Bacillota bacterium]|nr:ATP-dependent helicase [Bacillota bacterium]
MELFNYIKSQFGIDLNEQQIQAVYHKTGPALVLAGPGSGKTTVITARTAYLIMSGVEPENILTLTFNRSAKNEMEHRFNNIFGSEINHKVRFSTIHSFCNMVVRDYERKQGKRLKRIEGEEESEESKRKIIRGIYFSANGSNLNDDELENLINAVGLVKNKMIKELENSYAGIKNFDKIFNSYEEYKKTRLLMDFDDMLTYAYSILKKCPEILNYYKNKYRYIQVDEGQDISKIQFEILKLLVNKKNCNIFIVADDDQSIYGFRGAQPDYILNIEEQFQGCELFKLEKNYRSSNNIVEITSKFIKANKNRFDKNHYTINKSEADPFLIKVQDDNRQLDFILSTIKDKLKERDVLNIAVLYRNNLSSIPILDALERNKINLKVKQNRLFFFNHWLVSDILAFMRFSQNQNDIEAFTRIYYKMNRYISKSMLEQAIQSGYEKSVIDGILKNRELKSYQVNVLVELKFEFNRLAQMQPFEALDYIDKVFLYFENVKDYCDNTGVSFEYLYNLFGILKTLSLKCMNIPTFLERLAQLEVLIDNPQNVGQGKCVTLTTMHSAKGLEYDCVIMADLTESEIPGLRALELADKRKDNSLLEEERRLFYVGMTRAKKYLYLVSPQTKNRQYSERSVFTKEVMGLLRNDALGEIGEGVIIVHKKFGEGVVVSVDNGGNNNTVIEVDFKGKRRKIDFITCMENGLIFIG